MNPDAVSKSIPSGSLIARSAGAVTISANPPIPGSATTRSPTAKPATFSPTPRTIPATSLPGVNGRGGFT